MDYTVAFVGFRHGHVFDVLQRMKANGRFRIVACCEEDAATRETLARDRKVEVTHQDFTTMLAGIAFDVLVIGDYYGKRGSLALAALRAGRSVLSDKPICTRLTELAAIERELKRGTKRTGQRSAQPDARRQPILGAMLDLRDAGIFRRMRELVRAGEIGEVHSISFNGNHPLLPTKRPGWYFEKDKHGGTINDLGVHAFDAIPWITGLSFARIEAARAWATPAAPSPWFKDASQLMATLSNGCGVTGDLSYLVPESISYAFPEYWRFWLTGAKGVLTGGYNDKSVTLYRNGEERGVPIDASPGNPGGYLDSFLHALDGAAGAEDLGEHDVLAASRLGLLFQDAAERERRGVRLPGYFSSMTPWR